MAERVVDVLEVIEIDEEQRQRLTRTLRAPDRAGKEAVQPETTSTGLEGAVTNVAEVAPGAAALPEHKQGVKPAAKEGDKIGRNDPCWCGSGRKFKQCHGRP